MKQDRLFGDPNGWLWFCWFLEVGKIGNCQASESVRARKTEVEAWQFGVGGCCLLSQNRPVLAPIWCHWVKPVSYVSARFSSKKLMSVCCHYCGSSRHGSAFLACDLPGWCVCRCDGDWCISMWRRVAIFSATQTPRGTGRTGHPSTLGDQCRNFTAWGVATWGGLQVQCDTQSRLQSGLCRSHHGENPCWRTIFFCVGGGGFARAS